MTQRLFIKIETVPGESTDNRHRDEIEVLGWSWIPQATTQPSTHSSGSAAVRAVPPLISFSHYVDKSTPTLMQMSYTGTRVRSAVLSVVTDDTPSRDLLKITMENVVIGSVELTGEAGPSGITEKVTLCFDRITEEYTAQAGGMIRKGFDFSRNQTI